jgi:CBS domain containing-hemolysin-like protein
VNAVLLQIITARAARKSAELTDEEYRELLEVACQAGAIAQTEKEVLAQIIQLDRRTVREVMRPRSQMACISDELSVEEMTEAARRFKHRRLPVYDETPDTIVGILNTRTLLLDPQVDLAEAIEFPSFVPESMNLLRLLTSLQRQRRGMAMVLDEFGGTAGLVTLEDILEAAIGEIRSEGREEGFLMEKLAEGSWRVNANMRIDDFARECPELGYVEEVETMGGLLTMALGVVPVRGESAVVRGLRLTATVADERRVRELLVEAQPRKGGR